MPANTPNSGHALPSRRPALPHALFFFLLPTLKHHLTPTLVFATALSFERTPSSICGLQMPAPLGPTKLQSKLETSEHRQPIYTANQYTRHALTLPCETSSDTIFVLAFSIIMLNTDLSGTWALVCRGCHGLWSGALGSSNLDGVSGSEFSGSELLSEGTTRV